MAWRALLLLLWQSKRSKRGDICVLYSHDAKDQSGRGREGKGHGAWVPLAPLFTGPEADGKLDLEEKTRRAGVTSEEVTCQDGGECVCDNAVTSVAAGVGGAASGCGGGDGGDGAAAGGGRAAPGRERRQTGPMGTR